MQRTETNLLQKESSKAHRVLGWSDPGGKGAGHPETTTNAQPLDHPRAELITVSTGQLRKGAAAGRHSVAA